MPRCNRRSTEPQRCARRQASAVGPLLLVRDCPDTINQSVTSVAHFPLISVSGFSAVRSQQSFAPRSAPLSSSPCAVFPTDLCCSLHLSMCSVPSVYTATIVSLSRSGGPCRGDVLYQQHEKHLVLPAVRARPSCLANLLVTRLVWGSFPSVQNDQKRIK